VKMRGYHRRMVYQETGLVWVAPSPNIPTVNTALVYAGTVLVEGTNLSEGRGTTRPFQLIGAPWIEGDRLAREMNRLGLEGVTFRRVSFTPHFSKYRSQVCSGVELHVHTHRRFEPVTVAVALLETVKRLYPEKLRFGEDTFDRLAGTSRLREALERSRPFREVVQSWQVDLEEYRERRKKYLLYD